MLEKLAILMLMITQDFLRLHRALRIDIKKMKTLLRVVFLSSQSFRIKLVIELSICIMKPCCDSQQGPKLKLVIITIFNFGPCREPQRHHQHYLLMINKVDQIA